MFCRATSGTEGGAVSVDIVVKKTIRINGREYGSLDEVPPEARAAVEQAFASASDVPSEGGARITVNGRAYSDPEELPAILRAIVQVAVTAAAKHGAPDTTDDAGAEQEAPRSIRSLRLEPVVSPRVIAVFALLLVVFLLLRYAL
jgi:hypothetical protein